MRLVGLAAGAIAANDSHTMDKRAHSRASYHTAGSEHVPLLVDSVDPWADKLRGGADGNRLACGIAPSSISRGY